MYSSAKFGRFKSNCMTDGKLPCAPVLLGCSDLSFLCMGFHGV